ncbi:MAG TPA: ABC transporter ATP-binding protein [Vicinamibacterales bacterium]|nr:ABC transporter ATP-binding protein [Vicinamibacterales bacterium]
MASISLQGVSKRFAGGVSALTDLNLEIAHGELLVLVGPSGSGKSTVLRLIAGLDEPTSGRVLIDGKDVTGVPPQQRDLAMVFQSYALYPHKTVRENLAFGLQMRRVDTARIDERVREVARTLGIDALLDRRPAALSGGQRQRVALGRAIVRDPKAFLLDEPLSNLDPVLRIEMRAELTLLHRRLGATMVYVTHDQEEAMTLGSRIAVMRDGAIEQVAAPMDLYDRPADTFVAGFIGSPAMNIWPCTIVQSDGRGHVRADGFQWDDLPVGDVDGERVLIGARPHDVDITSPDASDAIGRVEILEPLGPTMLAHVGIDGSESRVRIVIGANTRMAIGDRVGFRVRRDRLHWFNRETGRRLDPK